MKACAWEPLGNVKGLIEAGADMRKADQDGFGPIMCACVNGRTDVVQYLLARGAKSDAEDNAGRTPLSWTVTKGDFVETADALVRAGADVNRADIDGFTPLMRAALTDHPRCFAFLLGHGADVNPVNDYWHKTALEMAIDRGGEELKRLAEDVLSQNKS